MLITLFVALYLKGLAAAPNPVPQDVPPGVSPYTSLNSTFQPSILPPGQGPDCGAIVDASDNPVYPSVSVPTIVNGPEPVFASLSDSYYNLNKSEFCGSLGGFGDEAQWVPAPYNGRPPPAMLSEPFTITCTQETCPYSLCFDYVTGPGTLTFYTVNPPQDIPMLSNIYQDPNGNPVAVALTAGQVGCLVDEISLEAIHTPQQTFLAAWWPDPDSNSTVFFYVGQRTY
ncbi:hypothetical protein MMC09_005490 [Bachmanniomyces sp. S44760]|nr:hypothetical protein [Bachmanniomyces sp. S44760]